MNKALELMLAVTIVAIFLVPIIGATDSATSIRDVSNESFTVDIGTYVELNNDDIVNGSDVIECDEHGVVQQEGNYTMNYSAGTIRVEDHTSSVIGESWVVNVSNWVQLNESDLVNDSETVYDSNGKEMEKGTDYELNYTNGSIKALDGGELLDGETASIDYEYYTPVLENGDTVYLNYSYHPDNYLVNEDARFLADLVVLILLISVVGVVGAWIGDKT